MSPPADKDQTAPAARPRTSPAEFMRQVQAEARKVVWPTRQETVTTAVFVAILMAILALFFLGVDTAFSMLVHYLLTLA